MSAFADACERLRRGSELRAEASALVGLMTPEERLACLDGDIDCWPGLADIRTGGYYRHAYPAAVIERLGIPGLQFGDGPRGCVIGHSTAFPVSMGRGATWDPELEERIGEAIGVELRANGATFTGAVCVNLLRHPGWGRAQETYGEDPFHVGEMGAALTRGLQRHVMACVKHFACNSMENARFSVDVTAGERALHEVYLPHFKRIVDEGVASVMSAYNSLNGEWCGQNRELLRTILRDEWGFEGAVISDFVFGLRDAPASVRAGLDIEMPFRQQRSLYLPDALARGDLDWSDVDARATTVVAMLLRFADLIDRAAPPISVVACDAHRSLAREAAAQSMTLLTNRGLLPLDTSEVATVAVLGKLAAQANLGDNGSSDVHPPSVVTLLDGVANTYGATAEVRHDPDDAFVGSADLVIVVVGSTAHDEGEYISPNRDNSSTRDLMPPMTAEDRAAMAATLARQEPTALRPGTGGDRRTLSLSDGDTQLVERATGLNNRTVVCLMGGSAFITESWKSRPAAILHCWYPGMEGGYALADVLTGVAEPGGRLPFAIPTSETHLPDFDVDATEITYDISHGQWRLDRDGHAPGFAFGFGLGYGDVRIVTATLTPTTVRVELANRGNRSGSGVVQLYASVAGSRFERPIRRLVGFARSGPVDPGRTEQLDVPWSRDPLRIRHEGAWVAEDLPVTIEVSRWSGDPESISLATAAS